MISFSDIEVQIPLIHFVESDDLYLEAQEDVFWFGLLRDLDWSSLRPVAARYYEALWQLNEQQAKARAERSAGTAAANPETPFERATLCEDARILHEPKPLDSPAIRVESDRLRPGRTPVRFAGRAPKCFFAMFKAFMPENDQIMQVPEPGELPASVGQRRRGCRHGGQVDGQDVLGTQGIDDQLRAARNPPRRGGDDRRRQP